MTLPDNVGTIQIGDPNTFSNNNQQLASIEVGNQHHFPGNDQQLTPIGIGNPPVLQNSDQQLAPIQFGSFQNPSPQGNENPPPPPRCLQNSLYDPIYEQLGFPVDLTLRMYLASKRNRGGDS
ncbi:PREDICTED: uncharacterized protein LOC109344864 [Lupinus angustifolius]|nr:PREDICTED: uncharacterized protein LOC109344864 [Lupinus angustifolius]